MPIFLAVLMTRQAISPRLAISILLNIKTASPHGTPPLLMGMTPPAQAASRRRCEGMAVYARDRQQKTRRLPAGSVCADRESRSEVTLEAQVEAPGVVVCVLALVAEI